MRRKRILIIIVCLLVVIAGYMCWRSLASTTRIALINFQQFQTTSIVKSNSDPFVTYEEVSLEELGKLSRYDFVLGFGMGLRISAEQREQIQSVADKGTPTLIYAATNPENKICNLDSLQQLQVEAYLSSGNRKNYQSMAHYIRAKIDRKSFFVTPADSVSESVSDVFFHLDDNISFSRVAEYESYLKDKGFYREQAPKVAIIGGFSDPFGGNRAHIDSMIVRFQQLGMNVYPISSFTKRLEMLKEVTPDAVVYFAHGRLVMGQADAAAKWLKERNIPLFAALHILQTEEEWKQDEMGMFGGMMSQSIVVPELDGAIYPYVVNAQEIDEDGLYLFKAIPERLENFSRIIANFMELKRKKNADKKIAIYYFKGAGQETLTAQGLETVPSLYNFLKRLQAEGYQVTDLPATEEAFEQLLMTQGAVLSTYAEGAFDDYLKNGKPALVEKDDYESWVTQSLPEKLYANVTQTYGEAPGRYMSVRKDGKSYLAVARIELGNIVLLPQPMAALGEDAFAIVHGTESAPPHTYIGAYLWAQYAFRADALLHFGTHGSLEFTPRKQVALSNYDWPDRLVGTLPHFYYYTIGNIGESMMAKRRSYATTISYLTPPFMESNTRSLFHNLQDKVRDYYQADGQKQEKASLEVKKIVLQMGIHRELRLDSLPATPYTTEEIERIENFAEEIANEKMTGALYTAGVPYEPAKIRSSVLAMSADPIAYSLAALDKKQFTRSYLEIAKALVNRVLDGQKSDTAFICSVAGVTKEEIKEAHAIMNPKPRSMAQMMSASSSTPTTSSSSKKNEKKSSGGGHPAWIPKFGKKPEHVKEATEKGKEDVATMRAATTPSQPLYTKEQKERARAIDEVVRTISNITYYREMLQQSPELEMQSLLNALNGGYIEPGSGGDAVANPQAVPTGRNLYAVNAEATPTEDAWEKGVKLAKATLEQYKKQHGIYPKKVSYTFWSSEFIETQGATIAQVLYMLGVEPVRDAFGRVSDLQLISSETLGRPRVDVVVQTSGQFRDLAASRLALITRAVEMAAEATGDTHENYVSASTTDIERRMVEQGIPPVEAREMSTKRVFGGLNGMYGTGIQEMVKSGDRWEDEQGIAETYLHNVGAVYDSEQAWGEFHEGLLRAVLHNTDVVVQPRQSNTWGALSLDHVFEFMGGLNLSVRAVTGKDPDAFFADYRNRNNVRIQELKEAIGVESRSTIFNPAFIKEMMKGKAGAASQITEVVTNTYGWNVMKPDVIDNEMWDKIYDVYVKDSYKLGVHTFYKDVNPAAMQEITAVMMETARKGMWKATETQLADIAKLHTELVHEFGPSASGFAGSNVKLQEFITNHTTGESAAVYKQQISEMRTPSALSAVSDNGMVLKKNSLSDTDKGERTGLNGILIVSILLVAFILLMVLLRRKQKNNK